MNTPLRVRYAPSPTGDLHLGSLRTVIYDYLIARQTGGTFILRIEDTDRARLVEGSVERQVEGLYWMGLVPDEGVCLDDQGKITEKGSYGPYTQSHRLPIYHEHVEKLLDSGAAYRCFCTSERLEKMREEQQARKEIPRYDRLCRGLSREESDSRANNEAFVIRHAVPLEGELTFEDGVRGPISFKFADLDDYVLLKTDKYPTYQLASVVDDHLMNINLVMRGEEWISSTPKNILLHRAFGWIEPAFAHLPVILGPDGKHKLSKRDGDVSVLSYRDRGYLPEAMLNMLAFVGWSPGTEEEFFNMDELVERFRLDKVQKAAGAFSFDRLDFLNGWYIRRLPAAKVAEIMAPYLEKEGIVITSFEKNYVEKVAAAIQERLKHFDEAPAFTRFFFERPKVTEELRALIVPKKGDPAATASVLSQTVAALETYSGPWEHDEIKDFVMNWIAEQGMKNGDVLWPVRAALTGEPASPGAFEMLAILGREESLARLQAVVAQA